MFGKGLGKSSPNTLEYWSFMFLCFLPVLWFDLHLYDPHLSQYAEGS